MTALPAGWAPASIGDLCSLKNGRAFKPSEWSSTGTPIVRIQNLNNPAAPFNHYLGVVDERNRLTGGELLFAWSGTPGTSFGAHVWRGAEAVLNQHIFRVDFDREAVDKRYFLHAINQTLAELIDKAHGGVGLRHVTKGKFESTLLSVAPRAEQTRIADKLDKLLARIDACRDRLGRMPGILKAFKRSVLQAATNGSLTDDWRTARRLAPPRSVRLGAVAHGFNYGTAAKSTAQGRVPVLRMGNIQSGLLDWTDLVYTSDDAEIARYALASGDLLFNRTNSPELVGKTAVYRGERPAVFAGYLIRVRCGEDLLPEYLNHCLGAPAGRDYCRRVKSDGVSQSNINAKKLADFEFLLPAVDEQREIVRQADVLLTAARALEVRLGTALQSLAHAQQACLAKAFRGELVAQNPSDEPAAKMLARLAASKAPQKNGRRVGGAV